MKNLSALVTAVVLIAGCSSTGDSKIPEKFNGRPAAFRDGYNSGCNYGRAEASGSKNDGTRDEKRLQSEPDYANGWYDGFEWCRDNYLPSSTDLRHDETQPVRTEGGW